MDFDVNSALIRQRNNELTRLTIEFSTLEDILLKRSLESVARISLYN